MGPVYAAAAAYLIGCVPAAQFVARRTQGKPWGPLAETAASTGAWMNVDQERQAVVGLEINANHLRGKRSGDLTAVAKPLHVGRTTQVWEVRITDEQDKAVCVSRCTLAVIAREPG